MKKTLWLLLAAALAMMVVAIASAVAQESSESGDLPDGTCQAAGCPEDPSPDGATLPPPVPADPSVTGLVQYGNSGDEPPGVVRCLEPRPGEACSAWAGSDGSVIQV